MKKGILLLVAAFLPTLATRAQSPVLLTKDLPPYCSVLTTWGVHPEWDEKAEHLYFLNKKVGDVFKINLKTRAITLVTTFYHGGVHRVRCLPNGDLLLAMGGRVFDADEPERDRQAGLQLFLLKKDEPGKLYPLEAYCEDGLAVARNQLRLAWTLPGKQEIRVAELIYNKGIPALSNVRSAVSYLDTSAHLRLEAADFRPPLDDELIYTHYTGDTQQPFRNAQAFGLHLPSRKLTRYTPAPAGYHQAVGIFPDGKSLLLESERLPGASRPARQLDLCRLKLDGTGETERLAEAPSGPISGGGVVNRPGTLIAHPLSQGKGEAQGILLLDLEKFALYKAQRSGPPRKIAIK